MDENTQPSGLDAAAPPSPPAATLEPAAPAAPVPLGADHENAFDPGDGLVPVVYVGGKPFAVDNVAHTGKLWNGFGDVQRVTGDQAKALTRYADQWALVFATDRARTIAPRVVIAGGSAVNVDALRGKPLEKMTKPELLAYAKEKLGKVLDATHAKKMLIDEIEDLEGAPGTLTS